MTVPETEPDNDIITAELIAVEELRREREERNRLLEQRAALMQLIKDLQK